MKHFIIFLLCAISTNCFAQYTTIDTVKYQFNYAIKYSTDEELPPSDDEIVVEIGKEKTMTYGYWDRANELAYDSIKSHGGSVADYLALGNPIAMFRDYVIKNYPKKGLLSVTTYHGKDFIYSEPIVEKKWNLEEGDTTILGYNCRKASCTFRHRSWNVWYTEDIPIPEGPWKLDGLPGMILKAVDTRNQFSFECIGIKENVNKPMTAGLSKHVKTTPVYIERLEKLHSSNFDAYHKLIGSPYASYGKISKMTACLLEYYEKTNTKTKK